MNSERKFYYNGNGDGYCGHCLEGIIEENPGYYTEVDKAHPHYGMVYCENCNAQQGQESE